MHSSRIRAILLLLVLLTCYAYFLPRWGDWNQNSRFDLVQAVVDGHTLTIDKYVSNTGDYALYRGHHYSDKAPGMAFLGVPVYAAFRAAVPESAFAGAQRAVSQNASLDATLRPGGLGVDSHRAYSFAALVAVAFMTVALPSALLGLLFFQMAGYLGCGRGSALASTLLYALGTIAFPYSNDFVSHQFSAFLLFAAFAVLFALREGRLGRGWLPVAGFLLGYAAITEYPNVLIGGLLAIYAFVALEKPVGALARMIIGGFPPLVALAVHNWMAFGTVLPIGYLYSGLFPQEIHSGFFSLTYPRSEALWGITFSLYRGLFFISPYLLFALPGFLALHVRKRNRLELWFLALSSVFFLLFNASSALWDGGFAVGPRYLVPSLPFLALAAGLGLQETWRLSLYRPVVVAASGWSVFTVWAETIGGQSFPDYTANPLFNYSLPKLAAGDVARNVGMLVGLRSWESLAPLALFVALVMAVIIRLEHRGSGAGDVTIEPARTGVGVAH